jgi:hypothetical protein
VKPNYEIKLLSEAVEFLEALDDRTREDQKAEEIRRQYFDNKAKMK